MTINEENTFSLKELKWICHVKISLECYYIDTIKRQVSLFWSKSPIWKWSSMLNVLVFMKQFLTYRHVFWAKQID